MRISGWLLAVGCVALAALAAADGPVDPDGKYAERSAHEDVIAAERMVPLLPLPLPLPLPHSQWRQDGYLQGYNRGSAGLAAVWPRRIGGTANRPLLPPTHPSTATGLLGWPPPCPRAPVSMDAG